MKYPSLRTFIHIYVDSQEGYSGTNPTPGSGLPMMEAIPGNLDSQCHRLDHTTPGTGNYKRSLAIRLDRDRTRDKWVE